LVLLGDGPLRPDLVRLISELGLQSCVLLPGFKQYDELPAYYALAGAFIHASTVEQWGLVVNEAMASGLPVLVSNRCGCAKDLVQENINGFTFDPNNIDQLSGLMVKISAGSFSRDAYGAASSRIIAGWNPDRFAQGLSQALQVALAAPLPRSNFVDRALLQLLSRK
jgi:glycosyltransferase involved in cell wall biosynthesis